MMIIENIEKYLIYIFMIIIFIQFINIIANIKKNKDYIYNDEDEIDNDKITHKFQKQNINIVKVSIDTIKDKIILYKDLLNNVLDGLDKSNKDNKMLLDDNLNLSVNIKTILIKIDTYQTIIDEYTV